MSKIARKLQHILAWIQLYPSRKSKINYNSNFCI